MNILVLGGGGREHTFAWKLIQSPLCDGLHVAPGNAGTAKIAHNAAIDIMNFKEVESYVLEHKIELMIVGPEAPLVAGITDYFEEHIPSLMVIGPKKNGAILEGSKAFAKSFMNQYNIPTAAYLEVTESNLQEGIKHLNDTDGPFVLKAAKGFSFWKTVLRLLTHSKRC